MAAEIKSDYKFKPQQHYNNPNKSFKINGPDQLKEQEEEGLMSKTKKLQWDLDDHLAKPIQLLTNKRGYEANEEPEID